MEATVIKSSGRTEKFDIQKLADSLVRSGAPPDVALEIANKVAARIAPTSHAKAIYRLARSFLRRYNRVSGMKYSLKKAIYALGPSGYPFEKYFAGILKAHGYSIELDRIVAGYCVKHEVDIMAVRGDEHCIIECKYHGNAGNTTDVKTALYVHSRVEDIRKVYAGPDRSEGISPQGWLVTNTRCTTDAISFAECAGLRVVSWRYPSNGSLEKMIEDKRLYPVTVLPAAGQKALATLVSKNIILVEDIAQMDAEAFLGESGLDRETAYSLKRQAGELCPRC